MPRRVVQRHLRELRRSLRSPGREGFRKAHVLRGVAEIENATVVTEKRYNDLTHLTGPFDIIGDVHGCAAELESLLGTLGYTDGVHPEGRTAVFVGDLVDRGPDGVRLAPFQIPAVQGRSLAALPHDEQLALLDRMVEHDATGLPRTTRRLYVDPADPESVRAGVDRWLEMTGRGGEGMVVKPVGALVRGSRGRLVQPDVKCRGREYLRIIYGPEYTRPENLARLRGRFLGHKRSLAVREYALGLEALDRLAEGEPLWRVHEAVFGVLAPESEPVDPRL